MFSQRSEHAVILSKALGSVTEKTRQLFRSRTAPSEIAEWECIDASESGPCASDDHDDVIVEESIEQDDWMYVDRSPTPEQKSEDIVSEQELSTTANADADTTAADETESKSKDFLAERVGTRVGSSPTRTEHIKAAAALAITTTATATAPECKYFSTARITARQAKLRALLKLDKRRPLLQEPDDPNALVSKSGIMK